MTATVQDMVTQKPLTVWYDSENKAIVQEIAQLRGLDTQRRLEFAHASASGFASEGGTGADFWRTLVYARKSDGAMVQGVAALEAAYDAVGLGSYFRFCRKPGLESGTLFAAPADELKQAA